MSCLKAFKRVNLKINHTKNRIYLCGKNNAEEFFKVIGSSNNKHLTKFNHFMKKGYVPKTKEIESYLKRKQSIKKQRGPMV